HLTLSVRRCHNPDCPRFLRPYRPEAEPHFALPYHEFGLDVMALVGRLRHAEHRSIPEIHRELTGRGLAVAQRTVTNVLDRSDGQGPIRKAVRKALEGVPHQLCHFHYLREAAKPISEADRHAKKELKKRVRGIRPIERRAEKEAESGPEDEESEVVRGYCAAV